MGWRSSFEGVREESESSIQFDKRNLQGEGASHLEMAGWNKTRSFAPQFTSVHLSTMALSLCFASNSEFPLSSTNATNIRPSVFLERNSLHSPSVCATGHLLRRRNRGTGEGVIAAAFEGGMFGKKKHSNGSMEYRVCYFGRGRGS